MAVFPTFGMLTSAKPIDHFARLCLAVAALAAAVFVSPAQAQTNAAVAIVSSNLNQRAGPSTQYPPLQVIPRGQTVTIYGCIRDLTWCDSMHRGQRGWVSARYVQVWSQGRYLTVAQYAQETRLPVLTFNLRTYWDRYYVNYAFYADRDRWLAQATPSQGPGPAVNVNMFYDRLSPHGRWVEMNGRYVWVPSTRADWRPYTDGRWVFTRQHGWMWVSNEPFGWATYHYGRWGYSHQVGWFWVPGTRWAPAWVSWRNSPDYIAWAPLPPDRDDPWGYNPGYQQIPDYYWQPVQSNLFLSINLNLNIIRNEEEKVQIVAATQEAGATSADANTVVNAAIAPEFVEQVTQETVTPVEVVSTSNPEQATSEQTAGDTAVVEVFQPPAEEAAPEVPPDVVSVETAASESTTAGQAPTDAPDTVEDVPPPPPAGEAPPPSDAPPPADAVETQPADAATGAEQTEPTEPTEIVCPEGTTLQDGECVLAEVPPPPPETPAEPAPAGEVVPPPPPADTQGQAPAETQQPAQTEQAPAQTEQAPPAQTEQQPPAQEQAAPPPPEAAPPPPAPEQPPQVEQPAEPPPAVEPPPPPAAEPPPPPAAEPPPPPAVEPPPPPAAEQPPAPPPEVAPPPAEQQAPACPEGYVLLDDGTCALPDPQ